MENTNAAALNTLGSNIDDDDENMAVPKAEARVKIMLEESDTIPPNGQYFGVQGTGYILKAGEEVAVPVSLVNVLNTCVMSVPVLDAGQRVIGYRDKLRFPYRVITDTRTSA